MPRDKNFTRDQQAHLRAPTVVWEGVNGDEGGGVDSTSPTHTHNANSWSLELQSSWLLNSIAQCQNTLNSLEMGSWTVESQVTPATLSNSETHRPQ